MKSYITLIILLHGMLLQAQDLPYQEIPPYPDEYTPGNVAARMVDGLGYRYYWATDGLREQDLSFKPSQDARTTGETIDHILGLSRTLLNTVSGQPNERNLEEKVLTFTQKREKTLQNLQTASLLLKSGKKKDMKKKYRIIFKRGDETTEFPFWNMINGPIADAIYHTGQVVSFRRSSGNPLNPKVNVFMGKNRE